MHILISNLAYLNPVLQAFLPGHSYCSSGTCNWDCTICCRHCCSTVCVILSQLQCVCVCVCFDRQPYLQCILGPNAESRSISTSWNAAEAIVSTLKLQPRGCVIYTCTLLAQIFSICHMYNLASMDASHTVCLYCQICLSVMASFALFVCHAQWLCRQRKLQDLP